MALEHKKHVNKEDLRPQPVVRWSFKANLKSDLPIYFAILGLLYSALVLLYNAGPSPGPFHDLSISNKRPLIDTLLSQRAAFLQSELQRLQPLAGKKGPDSTAIRDTLRQYRSAIARTTLQASELEYFNTDTSLLYFTHYFSADRDRLLTVIKAGGSEVDVQLKDTCCSPYPRNDIRQAKISLSRERKPLVDFFDRYSEFGFWFVLSIAQMSLWFMLTALVIGSVKKTDTIVPPVTYTLKYGGLLAITPAIIVAVFAFLVYFVMIKGPVISDDYFQYDFNRRMYWYSVPGYLLAILCFGAYLFLANKLELLNTAAMNAGKRLEDVRDQYNRLKSAFNFVFNSSAVILSVFVVWLGTLFSAVNNLEVARFYTLSSGKPLLNYDFVYLMGIIHSLLLAIFYFPVRIQFNALQLTQDDKSSKEGTPGTAKLFKTFADIIGGILVTASPFITTIVQKALTGLLGG